LTILLALSTFRSMSKTPDYSYIIFASGDAEWYREAAAPLAESLEEVVPFHGKEVPAPLQTVSGVVKNDWKPFAVLGCALFVAQHLTAKFLDDVYAQIQPRIKALLEKLDSKLNGGNRRAQKVFTVSVWYAEYNVLVSVSVVGKDFDSVVKQLHLVQGVLANALTWIATNGTQKPIHHYNIEDGKVNAAPVLLDRFGEMLGQ